MWLYLIISLQITNTLSLDFDWCTKSSPGFQKCEDLQREYQSAGIIDFSCSENLIKSGCFQDVKTEPKTVFSVNPGELYHAQRRGGKFKVILAEDYSSALSHTYFKYYSVAVVKAGRTDLRLTDLKGKRICHSGYDFEGKNGWDIPLSYLYTYHRSFRMNDRCDIIPAINNYFGDSCLPDPSGTIRNDMRLCTACSTGSCSRETKYRGYEGAFRCLVEDAGEVAFLTHSTVSDLTDGRSSETWTTGLKSSGYRLLCPDGSQVTVENYGQCFMGWMRPNVVVVGEDVSDNLVTKIQNNLRNPPPRAAEHIFDVSRYTALDGVDVIFSEGTEELRIVNGQEQYPRNYLALEGRAQYQFSYTRAMDALYCVTSDADMYRVHSILLSSLYITFLLI